MKALLLRDGDLVTRAGDYATVSGPSRVVQDLRLHLGEPLGNDRFHTGFGSTLGDWIGQTLGEAVRMDVENEVRRVVNNYTSLQSDVIQSDALSDVRPSLSATEVLTEISAISAVIRTDVVAVTITLALASGSRVTLVTSVDR